MARGAGPGARGWRLSHVVPLLIAVLFHTVSAAVIDVSPASAGGLAAAVQRAAAGDTLRLAKGTYQTAQLEPAVADLVIEGATGAASDVVLTPPAGGVGRLLLLRDAAARFRLSHVTLRGGKAAGGGCVLVDMARNTSRGVLFSSVAFESCSANAAAVGAATLDKAYTPNAGGAILFAGQAAPTLRACSFTRCAAVLGGGAVWTSARSAPVFEDCVWTENTVSTGFGGAVVPEESSSPVFRRNRFVRNFSGAGGAVDTGGTATPRFEDCVFLENWSDYGGGAVYHYGDDRAVFERCRFEGNRGASGGGGAVIVSTTCRPTYADCYFANHTNDASGGGGGGTFLVTGEGAKLTILRSTVRDSRGAQGGVFYLRGAVSLEADGLVADGAVSTNLGGGLAVLTNDGGELTLRNSRISNMVARNDMGGAVLAMPRNAPRLRIERTVFENCTAADLGGVIAFSDGSLDALGASFLGNTGESGGAVAVLGTAAARMEECLFERNVARARGGAILVEREATLSLVRSVARGNSAPMYGGALYTASEGEVRLEGGSFEENRAASGGAFAVAKAAGAVAASGARFLRNLADVAGGVYYLLEPPGSVQLANGTVVEGNGARWGNVSATRPARVDLAGPANVSAAPGAAFTVSVELRDALGQLVLVASPPVLVQMAAGEGLVANTLVPSKPFAGGRASFEIDVEGRLGEEYAIGFGSDYGAARLRVTVLPCPRGFATSPLPDGRFRCIACEPGTYNLGQDGVCRPCPTGATCPGGGAVLARDGFWLDPASIGRAAPAAYRCPRGLCCPTGACGLDAPCAARRRGVLCGDCEAGYSDWGGECTACTTPQPALLVVPVAAACGLVAIFWVASAGDPSSGKAKSVVFFVQASAFVVTDVSVVADLSWDSLLSSSLLCPFQIDPVHRSLLGFWIPALSFVLLLLLVCAATGLSVLRTRRPSLDSTLSRRLFVTAVQLAAFSYIAIANTSIKLSRTSRMDYWITGPQYYWFLDCISVGENRVLRRSPAVSCDTPEYRRWVPLAWAMIAGYVVLVPLLFGAAVWRLRRRGGAHLRAPATRLRWGVLYACYRPPWVLYEGLPPCPSGRAKRGGGAAGAQVFFMARRILLIAVDVAFGNNFSNRSLGMFLASTLFVAVHEGARPFATPLDNALESLFLISLLLTSALEMTAAAALEAPAYSVRAIQYSLGGTALLIGGGLIAAYLAFYISAAMKAAGPPGGGPRRGTLLAALRAAFVPRPDPDPDADPDEEEAGAAAGEEGAGPGGAGQGRGRGRGGGRAGGEPGELAGSPALPGAPRLAARPRRRRSGASLARRGAESGEAEAEREPRRSSVRSRTPAPPVADEPVSARLPFVQSILRMLAPARRPPPRRRATGPRARPRAPATAAACAARGASGQARAGAGRGASMRRRRPSAEAGSPSPELTPHPRDAPEVTPGEPAGPREARRGRPAPRGRPPRGPTASHRCSAAAPPAGG
eukprot:tig00000737_g3794.t1